MKNYKKKAVETAKFLGMHIQKTPDIGLLTGTGLGECAESIKIATAFSYQDLPHFPISTVESHKGKLLLGEMNGKNLIAMQGRFHLYEGYSPLEVSFPIRVMQELGVKHLIVSNAAGGLNVEFKSGDVMVIVDHINLTGHNPLTGPNQARWGIRFPDMTCTYDPDLITLADNAGKTHGIHLKRGVYAGLSGPSLETPAEVRFLIRNSRRIQQ